MRLSHLSDLHWSNARLDEKIRCSQQLLQALAERKPDIIIVAGDTFDHSVRMEDPAARAAVRFFGDMADIAPVLAIKGNFSHDRNSVELLSEVTGKNGVIVSTEPEIFVLDGTGITHIPLLEAAKIDAIEAQGVFCTLPYPSSSFLAQASRKSPEQMRMAVSEAITNVIRGYAAIRLQPGTPRILVFHGTVSGALATETQHMMGMDIELTLGDIAACGFDLVCAGHLHYAQQLGENVFYPGGLCYTGFGDAGRKGMWIHELLPLRSEYVAVDAVPMRVFEANLIESPFVEPPEWAAETMDLEIRLKLTDADREAAHQIDWQGMFPNATSIRVRNEVEAVASVRCEEVRQARRLRDKVAAYGKHAQISIPESVLAKADELESLELPAILEKSA